MEIARAAEDFAANGICRVPGYIPVRRCKEWCDWVDGMVRTGGVQRRVYETPKDPAILNEGGVFDHYIIHGLTVRQALPDMIAAYEATLMIVREVTGADAILSPYPQSAVNINRYDGPGGQMSRHYDSNPISVVLQMTDNPDEGATEFFHGEECYRREYPARGDLLIFKGRDLLHSSQRMEKTVKVVGIWNFYTSTDQHRPEGMDDFMYNYQP